MNNNLPEAVGAWNTYQARFDMKLALASGEIALRLEGAGKRMIVGQRNPEDRATPNKPPMNRTGNLRRSIKGSSGKIGFGIYESVVGAGMVYARAVEMGGEYAPPSWKNGQRFPFLEPAVKDFISTGMITRILIKHMGAL
jgi:hypothetical protein